MRGKRLWRAVITTVGITVSVVMASSASAASILDEVTETVTNASYAEDIGYNRLRSSNLNYGKTTISMISGSEVNVSGLSQCDHVCDKVYLSMSLERKIDGSYATYKMWDFTTLNASNLYKSINVLVPSGYYYRIRGYHAAKDSGLKESTETLTSGILVK